MNNMYMIILKCRNAISKYRNVILSGLILFSLIAALLTNGDALRSGFLGMGTGIALVSFGESISQMKKNPIR